MIRDHKESTLQEDITVLSDFMPTNRTSSSVRLFEAPWTVDHQTRLSMGILQARILEWVAIFSSRESSPRD